MRRVVQDIVRGVGGRVSPRSARAALVLCAAALGAFGLRAPAAHAAIMVGFSPASITVAPGDTFTVSVAVLQIGSEFNAFDASIRFDPSRLTFVSTSPVSNQRGSLITSACSNTFHRFDIAPDSLKVTLSLLCSNTFLTGPGVIYQVKFQAGATLGNTTITLGPYTEFYRAGLFVRPLVKQDLTITVNDGSLDVGPGDPARKGLEFAPPSPNPRRGSGTVSLDFALPSTDLVSIDVLDLQGRRIAERGTERLASGRHHVAWTPPALPSGDYFVRMRTRENGSVTRRWAVLR